AFAAGALTSAFPQLTASAYCVAPCGSEIQPEVCRFRAAQKLDQEHGKAREVSRECNGEHRSMEARARRRSVRASTGTAIQRPNLAMLVNIVYRSSAATWKGTGHDDLEAGAT